MSKSERVHPVCKTCFIFKATWCRGKPDLAVLDLGCEAYLRPEKKEAIEDFFNGLSEIEPAKKMPSQSGNCKGQETNSCGGSIS